MQALSTLRHLGRLTAAALALACAPAAHAAAEPIRIGVIGEFSGIFAIYGQQSRRAIDLFLKEKGNEVAGHKIEVIYRDTGGANPEQSRRAAQELVTRDGVKFLAGFGLTPNALAAAPVATQTRTPMIIMNAAATSIVPTKSPYIVRLSVTQQQLAKPLATWAAKSGIKRVYTIVPDYAPGIDTEKFFSDTFKAAGGDIAGSVRVPLANAEFAPYLQRAADAKPDALLFMSPSGDQGVQFVKTFKERGLAAQGIKILSTGELTDEVVLDHFGEDALGLITSMHYSMAHDSPANRAYVAAYRKAYGAQARPNWYGVGAWDGMAAIYDAIAKLGGAGDGAKVIETLKQYRAESPRGPIRVDANRDIVQDIYIRRVERVDGVLQNVEFETFRGMENQQ